MRRAAVLLVLAFLASVVVDAAPRAALGNHGGREVGSLFTCDRPVHAAALHERRGRADPPRRLRRQPDRWPGRLAQAGDGRGVRRADEAEDGRRVDRFPRHRCDRLLRRLRRERRCGLGLLPRRRAAGREPVRRPMVPAPGDPLQPQPAVRGLLRRRRQSRPRDLPRARAHARPPPLGQSPADRWSGSRRDLHELEHPGRPDPPAPVRYRSHQRVRLPAHPAPRERERAAGPAACPPMARHRGLDRGGAARRRAWARWSTRPTRWCAAGSSPWCPDGSSEAATTIRCTTHRPRSRSRPSSPARCRRRIGPA